MADEVKKDAPAGVVPPVAKAKRPKKLTKGIEGTVVVITEGETKQVLKYDFAKLPKEIQDKLGPFGLGHKLGDAAAGKVGKDAVDAIAKVFDGLMKNDWSVRAPAAEKISKNDIKAKLDAMTDPKAKAMAEETLRKLGLLV